MLPSHLDPAACPCRQAGGAGVNDAQPRSRAARRRDLLPELAGLVPSGICDIGAEPQEKGQDERRGVERKHADGGKAEMDDGGGPGSNDEGGEEEGFREAREWDVEYVCQKSRDGAMVHPVCGQSCADRYGKHTADQI